MFGRGRFQNGILIEPEEHFAIDPSDTQQLVTFRNMIWWVTSRLSGSITFPAESADETSLDRPTVESANEFAPQHSRIFKEVVRSLFSAHTPLFNSTTPQMILVTHPSKPFQFNVKGLPRRGVILVDYHDEIETLYKEVEDSARSDIPAPATWDETNILMFVRTVVESTLRHSIADDADIFRSGGDRYGLVSYFP